MSRFSCEKWPATHRRGALAVGQNLPSAQTKGFGARAGVRIDACVMYNPDWAP